MDFNTQGNLEIISKCRLSEEQKALFSAIIAKRNYQYLGSGRHRHTFQSPNGLFVVKVPKNQEGIKANENEAKLWKKGFDPEWDLHKEHMARCKLHSSGLLVMEYVALIERFDYKSPEFGWAVRSIDCGQIGRTLSGRIVAYDYTTF